jgi:hypothetical protein
VSLGPQSAIAEVEPVSAPMVSASRMQEIGDLASGHRQAREPTLGSDRYAVVDRSRRDPAAAFKPVISFLSA